MVGLKGSVRRSHESSLAHLYTGNAQPSNFPSDRVLNSVSLRLDRGLSNL